MLKNAGPQGWEFELSSCNKMEEGMINLLNSLLHELVNKYFVSVPRSHQTVFRVTAYSCHSIVFLWCLVNQAQLSRVLHCDKTRWAFENKREMYKTGAAGECFPFLQCSQMSEFISWVQIMKENKVKLKLVFEALLVHKESRAFPLPFTGAARSMKILSNSCQILYFRWLEILGLVANFELLKTLPQGGELWIEILSQGLGSLIPKFCFWSNCPPYPVSPPPPPSGIALIAALLAQSIRP